MKRFWQFMIEWAEVIAEYRQRTGHNHALY